MKRYQRLAKSAQSPDTWAGFARALYPKSWAKQRAVSEANKYVPLLIRMDPEVDMGGRWLYEQVFGQRAPAQGRWAAPLAREAVELFYRGVNPSQVQKALTPPGVGIDISDGPYFFQRLRHMAALDRLRRMTEVEGKLLKLMTGQEPARHKALVSLLASRQWNFGLAHGKNYTGEPMMQTLRRLSEQQRRYPLDIFLNRLARGDLPVQSPEEATAFYLSPRPFGEVAYRSARKQYDPTALRSAPQPYFLWKARQLQERRGIVPTYWKTMLSTGGKGYPYFQSIASRDWKKLFRHAARQAKRRDPQAWFKAQQQLRHDYPDVWKEVAPYLK